MLKDDLSIDQGHQHGQIGNYLFSTGHRIIQEHDQVSELARLKGTLEGVFKGQVGIAESEQPSGLFPADSLVLSKHPPADGVASDKVTHHLQGEIGNHR